MARTGTILIVACLFATTAVLATSVRKCGKIPLPIEVRIEGCTTTPCHLKRGEPAKMEIDFSTDADYDVLWPKVYAKALGFITEFPIPGTICDHLQEGKCPIKANNKVTYLLEVPVLAIYPRIPLVITFQVVDKDKNALSCFSVNCKVV